MYAYCVKCYFGVCPNLNALLLALDGVSERNLSYLRNKSLWFKKRTYEKI